MPKNGNKTANIDTEIVSAEPLISYILEHSGGECSCVSFLQTSSNLALQEILEHTHQRRNSHTDAAQNILSTAIKQQKKHSINTVRSDDDARMTRHRLPHTKNRVTTQQTARKPINYIKKALGDESIPALIVSPNSERRFHNILETLPINPEKISPLSLNRMEIAPDNFHTYCGLAQEIFTRASWKKIAHILNEGKPVYRTKNTGRSSRIMQIRTPAGEHRYVLFVNHDTLHKHTTPSKTTQHKMQFSSFRVFEQYDDLLHSQEYAIRNLETKLLEYSEWQIALMNSRLGDKDDFIELLGEAEGYFGQQEGYYPKKIHHYIQRELKNPGQFLSHAIRNLTDAIKDITGKKQEIEQVYQNLAKGREKTIMEDTRQTAQLINR